MFAYCVRELGLSEDAAAKRIHAARVARRFTMLLVALAGGRLSLSAVVLLAPHLTPENAEELIGTAAHKTRAEIEVLLAQRFPKPDLPQVLREQHAPGHVPPGGQTHTPRSPGVVQTPRPTIRPLSPRRFALQVTVDQSAHDKLQYARELLGHQIPSGDLAQVLDLALDALIAKLEKRKFAATDHPRRALGHKPTARRTIPAHVRRAVWERDGGQCTFVGEKGTRCAARKCLEFDHVEPVARGGRATEKAVRLRCRTHNQYEAERVFGAGFMHDKRTQARQAQRPAIDADVMACLKTLGVRGDEARQAIAGSGTPRNAPLEERVRGALRGLGPRVQRSPRGYPRTPPRIASS
jgi:hypothetical protein